jgi:acyl-CoA dehydrogenase
MNPFELAHNEFAAALDRQLMDVCTPAAVRNLEQGGPFAPLWQPLQEAGFADAMLPETAGGAGLGVQEAAALWFTLGRHAYPLPMGLTQWLRASTQAAGVALPSGPLSLAPHATTRSDGQAQCRSVPCGAVAVGVAMELVPGQWKWLDAAAAAPRLASGIHGDLHAHWRGSVAQAPAWELPSDHALEWGALITAVHMAGALERVLELTLAFCEQRVQFGKPISKYQAVQHQLAQLAQEAAAARMAVEMACADTQPHSLRVAMAKARCGEAAATVAPMAHALHGAIGVTAEFELQRFTRALHAWRNDFGAAPYWFERIGQAALAAHGTSFEFLETQLSPV